MKYVVDTGGWIEWLTNSKLSVSFGSYLSNFTQLIVPTLVQYELYKWVNREKNSATALEIIGLTENGIVVPVDTRLSLYAADISRNYHLAMADAIIYATSRLNEAVLITSDKHFKKLPHVTFLEK